MGTDGQNLFRRTELLLGSEAIERLRRLRVIVFGTGGVGSWCAESLVRTGVGNLTLVDNDCVAASNINRQLMATTLTVGQPKVEVLRQRLLAINPSAHVTALHERYDETTADQFQLGSYDYVVDAIDSVKDKALLILSACQTEARLFSSMGAALKMDPQRIKVTEFWKVSGDPLARTLRKRFKKSGCMPSRKFLCVYSDELLQNQLPTDPDDRGNGTVAHITAIFGFTLASLVVRDACGEGVKR